MNIEEERKAFEAMIVSRDLGGAEFVKHCRDGNSYRPGLYLDMFEGWLAAKEHADSDIKMLLRVCAFESIEHARKWDVDKECQHVTAVTAQQFFDDGRVIE